MPMRFPNGTLLENLVVPGDLAQAWTMTRSPRAAFLPRGAAVFAAFPGGIDTDMLAGFPR